MDGRSRLHAGVHGRDAQLFLIEAGYQLVYMMAMGAILAVWL
jgi:hypothetical protein